MFIKMNFQGRHFFEVTAVEVVKVEFVAARRLRRDRLARRDRV